MKRDAIELREREEELDALLSRWHSWSQSSKTATGYGQHSAGFDGYRTSRQYDDSNGALDEDFDAQRCRAVDFAAEHLQDPWRAAIYAEARNLYTGAAVWGSPRLPADPAQRAMVVAQARGMMIAKLVSAGVMDV